MGQSSHQLRRLRLTCVLMVQHVRWSSRTLTTELLSLWIDAAAKGSAAAAQSTLRAPGAANARRRVRSTEKVRSHRRLNYKLVLSRVKCKQLVVLKKMLLRRCVSVTRRRRSRVSGLCLWHIQHCDLVRRSRNKRQPEELFLPITTD